MFDVLKAVSSWTPSNVTLKPIYSDSLNLMPPAPLYLRRLYGAIQMLLFTVAELRVFRIAPSCQI